MPVVMSPSVSGHVNLPADRQSISLSVARGDVVSVATLASLGARSRRADYDSFDELRVASEDFCHGVNARRHRETGRLPSETLAEERHGLHPLPTTPIP